MVVKFSKKELLQKEPDIEANADDDDEHKVEQIKVFKLLYVTWIGICVSIGLGIVVYRNEQCPSSTLPWVWMIMEFTLFLFSVGVEFKYIRAKPYIIKPYDVAALIWGVCGIIAYGLTAYCNIEGVCAKFVWDAILGCGITSVISILAAWIVAHTCY